MAHPDLSTVPISEFVSFAIETLLAGILIVTYIIAVCILLVRDRAGWGTVPFITSTAMLLLALAHLSLNMHHCYTGFVVYGGTSRGAATYLANTRNPVFIAKSVLYITQTLLGDAFMAYRIYILWDSSWVVAILPAVLISADAVIGYASCFVLAQDAPGKDLTNMGTTYSYFFLAFLVIATFYTVITTALVAFRIYRWKRSARRYNLSAPMTRRRVLETFIHSAAIYPVVLFSLFVTYVLGVNPEMFGVDFLPALIGIATTLITIRLAIVNATGSKLGMRRNANMSIRRVSAHPQMMLEDGRYTVQLPPPSKSTIFEPQEGPREILMELDLGDPARSSSATGFGRDLLEAVERVLGLHYSPSDGVDIVVQGPSPASRNDEVLA